MSATPTAVQEEVKNTSEGQHIDLTSGESVAAAKEKAIKNVLSAIHVSSEKNMKAIASKGETFFHGTRFLFANESYVDLEIGDVFREMATSANFQQINIAILVGEGHILSYLPEFSEFLDIIIFYDINETLKEHLQIMFDSIQGSNTPKEFLEAYKVRLQSSTLKEHVEKLLNDLGARKKLLGPDFFMESEERFLQCKHAFSKINWGFYHGDFSDLDHQKGLQTALEVASKENVKVNLKVLNISNLIEYHTTETELGNLQAAITLLSDGHEPVILFSEFYKGTGLMTGEKYICEVAKSPLVKDMRIAQHEFCGSDLGVIMGSRDQMAILNSLFNLMGRSRKPPEHVDALDRDSVSAIRMLHSAAGKQAINVTDSSQIVVTSPKADKGDTKDSLKSKQG